MPVPGSGLGSQVMVAEESTWSTAVTVTRALPFDDESFKFTKKPVQGQGLQAGAYTLQGSLRADTTSWVAGDLSLDVTSKGMGLIFKHMLGNVASAQQGATAAWKHTFTLGSQTVGKGMTIQVGRPTTDGTVRPRTYAGMKCTSWDLSAAAQDIVKLKTSWIGQARATATSLATPSYPTGNNIFYFKEGALTVGGSGVVSVRDFDLTGDNQLSTDRFYFGNNGLLAEPIRQGFTNISGKLTADFVDTSWSDAYVADSELSLVLTFVGAQIATGFFETLTVTCNGVRLNGDEETVSGPAILQNGVTFDVLVPKAGGTQVQLDYTTLDVTP